jgi:hypothetical protein
MKVVCKEIDPDRFQVADDHKAHFKRMCGAGKQPKMLDNLRIGQTYTVYACKISKGYPSYYVECMRRPGPWLFQPSLCFDIVDHRMSKLWHFATRVHRSPRGEESFHSIMAIKEWVDEPTFFERLVDAVERERAIMTAAAAEMDAEFV